MNLLWSIWAFRTTLGLTQYAKNLILVIVGGVSGYVFSVGIDFPRHIVVITIAYVGGLIINLFVPAHNTSASYPLPWGGWLSANQIQNVISGVIIGTILSFIH